MINDIPSFGHQYRYGSYSGPNPPPNCRWCGRIMIISTKRNYFGHAYDVKTGNPIEILVAKCSAPWWARLFRPHDQAVQDDHKDWPYIIS